MAYAQVNREVFTHLKTLQAARALRLQPVHLVGHLAALWAWATESAPDGDLSDCETEDIAFGACFKGDCDRFCRVLFECGWLIKSQSDPTKFAINDWDKHTGKFLQQSEKAKKRKKRFAEKDVLRTFLERPTTESEERSQNVPTPPHIILDQIRSDQIRSEKKDLNTVNDGSVQHADFNEKEPAHMQNGIPLQAAAPLALSRSGDPDPDSVSVEILTGKAGEDFEEGKETKPKPRASRKAKERQPDGTTAGSQIWEAYAVAYRARYGVDPLRNAMSNAICSRLSKRAPLTECVATAEYYLSINKDFFLAKGHDLKTLSNDFDSIRLQCLRGTKHTSTSAKQADLLSHNTDCIKRAFERLEEEKRKKAAHDGPLSERISENDNTEGKN